MGYMVLQQYRMTVNAIKGKKILLPTIWVEQAQCYYILFERWRCVMKWFFVLKLFDEKLENTAKILKNLLL